MIGIIAAMKPEAEALIAKMENKSEKEICKVKFTSGKIGEKDVVIAVSGIGKVNAAITATAMILEFKPDAVINTGVGGSLTEDFKIFDIAVCDSAIQYDMDTTAFGDPLGFISGLNEVNLKCDEKIIDTLMKSALDLGISPKKAIIATGDTFIEEREFKGFLNKKFQASVCEMEGASIGQVCRINNVPFGIIRCISDGEGSDHTDYNTFMKKAAQIGCQITEIFIGNYEV